MTTTEQRTGSTTFVHPIADDHEFDLEVDFVETTWNDFKGYYGSQPAYQMESEEDIEELRVDGNTYSYEDLLKWIPRSYLDKIIEEAMDNGRG